MENFKISVVVPAYNESENIVPLTDKLIDILSRYPDYEIIFVDDGSRDSTVDVIERVRANNNKIHYISFPETLVINMLYVPELIMQQGIVLFPWMPIYNIRRQLFLK